MIGQPLFHGADEEDADSILARDALTNMIGAFFVLCIVFLASVNVPGEENIQEATPPGNVTVEIYWPQELDTDVDLWVRGPKGAPVGYSNKGGEHYNLLRDDLGRTQDDPINYEFTTTRGLPPGPHCVNVHLYSNRSGVLPVRVTATVKIAKGIANEAVKGGGEIVLSGELDLPAEGKERNAFCFTLDQHGDMIREGAKKPFASDQICLRTPKGC